MLARANKTITFRYTLWATSIDTEGTTFKLAYALRAASMYSRPNKTISFGYALRSTCSINSGGNET